MSEGFSKPPPEDGQLGTAHDGTPVSFNQAMGRWLPVSGGAKGVAALTKAAPPPKADQKRVDDMLSTRQDARDLAGLINDFSIRNDRTKTGGMLAVPGVPSAVQAMGLKGSDELGVMDADAIQAATRMRAPGMRLTQMEFQKFLGGVPSIKKDAVANRPFQKKANNAAIMAGAQASFYDSFIRNHGSLNGADQAWDQFARAHFDPEGNYYHEGQPTQASRAPDPRAQANAALKAKSGRPVLLGIEPAP